MENKTINRQKNREKIDDLFRDNLDDHKIEPSLKVWTGIENKFMKIHFVNSGLRKWIVISSALIIIGLSTVYFLTKPESSNSNKTLIKQTSSNESHKITSIEEPNNIISEKNNITTEKISGTDLFQENMNEQKTSVTNNSDIINHNNKGDAKFYSDNKENIKPPDINNNNDYLIFKNKYLRMPLLFNPISNQYFNKINIKPRTPKYLTKFRLRDNYARKGNISFGVHFTPGIIYYRNRPKKNYYALDMDINYEVSKYTIQTGIGISREYENGEYIVEPEKVQFFTKLNNLSKDSQELSF